MAFLGGVANWLQQKFDQGENVGGRVIAQVNPFDNGRTYQNPTPQLNHAGSVLQQATHNGVTNFAGNALVKPLAQFPVDVSSQLYNRAIAPVFNLPHQNVQQEALNPAVANLAKAVNATGSLHQTVGSGLQTALTLGTGGLGKLVEGGVSHALPAAAPTLFKIAAPKLASNALIGGGFGGSQGISSGAKPLTIAKDTGLGAGLALTGAAGGTLAAKGGQLAGQALKDTVATRTPLNEAGSVKVPQSDHVALAQAIVNHYKGGQGGPAEAQVMNHVIDNAPQIMNHYDQRVMQEFGTKTPNIVSGDDAKYVVSGEDPLRTKLDPTKSAVYHEPASALAKVKYDQLLADKTTQDKPVLIMAGGSGAGKTSGLKAALNKEGKSLNDYAAVVDTNSNKLDSAKGKIDQALATGRPVEMRYVYRNPHEAFVNGVIPRGQKIGRIVPAAAHVDTHLGSREVVQQLNKTYADHPLVNVGAVDNSLGYGNAKLTSLDNLPKMGYNREELAAKLERTINEHQQQGKISPAEAQTYLGSTPRPTRSQELAGPEVPRGNSLQKALPGNGAGHGGRLEQSTQAQVAPMASVGDILANRTKTPIPNSPIRGKVPPNAGESSAAYLGGKPSRLANVTVQNSEKVTPSVKQLVKEKNVTYSPQAVKAGQAAAKAKYGSTNLDKATAAITKNLEGSTLGHITRQDVYNAHLVADRLQQAGTKESNGSAADIYAKLSEHHTAAGQQIQAAAALAKQSPQGMLYSASKALKGAGVKIDDKLQAKLTKGIDDFKNASGDDAKKVAYQKFVRTVNQNLPRSKAEAAIGLWRAGLLTGPETLAKVGVSHAVTAPIELASRPITAGIDKAIGIISGNRTVTFHPSDLGAFARGQKEGLKAIGVKLKTGTDVANTGGFDEKIGSNKHQTPYEEAVGRAHGSLFKPNYKGAFNMEQANQARLGVKGNQALEAANTYAQKFTNMNKTQLGEFANKIQSFSPGGVPVGKYIVPFSRIPTAIAGKGIIDWTPLGIVKGPAKVLIDKINGNSFDQRALSEALGRGLTGSAATTAVGYELAKHGMITLQEPTDPKEKALWAVEGKQRNSFKLGNKWISLNAFGPAGIAVGLGAAFQEATQKGQDPVNAALTAAAAAGKLVTDQPYFKGIAGASNALNDPKRYFQTYLNSSVGSLIPAGVQQAARGSDTVQRASGGVSDQLKGEVPGLREQLTPSRDLYGQAIPSNKGGSAIKDIIGTVNPFYPSTARNTNDAATQELQRLYGAVGSNGSPPIAPPQKSVKVHGQAVKLTPQQYGQFVAASGPLIHTGITNLLNNPAYQNLTDAQKTTQIKNVIDGARTAAKITQFAIQPKTLTFQTKAALSGPNQIGQQLTTAGSQKSATIKVPKIKTPKAPKAPKALKASVGRTRKAATLKGPSIASLNKSPKTSAFKIKSYKAPGGKLKSVALRKPKSSRLATVKISSKKAVHLV